MRICELFGLIVGVVICNLCSQVVVLGKIFLVYRSDIKVMPNSTLAEANEKKDWCIYQDFARGLIR